VARIRRPVVTLPSAPAVYDQREQNEFRRIVMQALGESVEDLERPSLLIQTTQSETEYEVVVTWTGTMTYRIDGAEAIAGGTSPQTLTIARNADPGPAIVYAFSVTTNGQTTVDTVTVLPQPATPAPSITIDDPQTADTGTDDYTYSWTVANMPGGQTYRVEYVYQDTAGTPEGRVPVLGTGVVDPATSGGTISSPEPIGASPTYTMTVRAMLGGSQIAVAYKSGTFQT
jgi:hypothetical protein